MVNVEVMISVDQKPVCKFGGWFYLKFLGIDGTGRRPYDAVPSGVSKAPFGVSLKTKGGKVRRRALLTRTPLFY